MLVDSHCHLDYLDRDGDLEEVIARAKAADVGTMVTICTKITEFDIVLGIAERFDNVWCTVGIHPHEAATEPEVLTERLVELAAHPKVIGIGETGLDYFYEHSSRESQKCSFRMHIAAARETGLPLIVHTRDADEDTIEILSEEHRKGSYPGLIHCYSSSQEVADKSIEMGFYISIAGILTFKSAKELQQTVARLPADRLLIETDSPYLAPVPKRGKRNEPAFVTHTAAKMAELIEESPEAIAAITTDNFFRLFSRAQRPNSR
jgi:TatD DNase family protein